MATTEQLKEFEERGFTVLENFLTDTEVEALRSECHALVEDMDPKEHHSIFKSHATDFRNDYFLESVDKVRFFFEEGALDDEGNLKVDKQKSLNKIGHALHIECESFKKVTFGEKIQNICKQLEYEDPVIIQSMYIFKQPGIGGVVFPHQDATYLYTEPLKKVFGIWIALEDADEDNSCLWFVPGSHKAGLYGDWRMVLSTNDKGGKCSVYEGGTKDENGKPKAPSYDEYGDYIPVPVKKGSLVLIDGLVLHKSEPNHSERSRHIYTFHIYDQKAVKWSEKNWAQPSEQYKFASVYRDGPKSA